MLEASVLETTGDLLAHRPDVASLLREDGISEGLLRLAPVQRSGLWAMGHLLAYAAGKPCGLVALYAVKDSPRTLVLGSTAGRLVIGKRRTLAALGIVRHLRAHAEDWDVLLIAGGGPESRRFETAARTSKLPRRLVSGPGTAEPLLAINSQTRWRSRWRMRSASDAALFSHWRTDRWHADLEADLEFPTEQSLQRNAAETVLVQPATVEFGHPIYATQSPESIVASMPFPHLQAKPAAKRPMLRVVSPDDD